MKIAFIGQKGIPAVSGGVERHVEDLAVRLAERGHEIIAYTRPHYTDPSVKSYKGVRLVSLPSFATKSLDAITHTFFACIDVVRHRVDVIHFHSIGPSSLIWLARLLNPRAKILSTFHSRDYYQEKWGWFARLYLRFGERMACKSADATIAISKSLARSAEEHYGTNVAYIPNGVAEARHLTPHTIKQWGLEKNNYILTVARLIPNKGIHDLITAYQQLETDKKLVIVGSGSFTESYERSLKELAADNPNIIFTASQSGETLEELYSNAALFVQSSELEGLSIALLEAMSYGKPILVSDIPENIEALAGNGITFKVKDSEDLARQMKYCLEEHAEMSQLAEKALQRSRTEYAWSAIITNTETVYTEVLNDRSAKRHKVMLLSSRLWTLL